MPVMMTDPRSSLPPKIQQVAVTVTSSDTIIFAAVDETGRAWKMIGKDGAWVKLPELPCHS